MPLEYFLHKVCLWATGEEQVGGGRGCWSVFHIMGIRRHSGLTGKMKIKLIDSSVSLNQERGSFLSFFFFSGREIMLKIKKLWSYYLILHQLCSKVMWFFFSFQTSTSPFILLPIKRLLYPASANMDILHLSYLCARRFFSDMHRHMYVLWTSWQLVKTKKASIRWPGSVNT